VLAATLYAAKVHVKTGGEQAAKIPEGSTKGARLVVLVDNNPYREGLETAWGLSAYVEAGGARIFFDTGPDSAVLKRNAERLGVDLGRVDFAVASHAHGGHAGGLKLLAPLKPGLRVYMPPDEGLRRYVESLGLEPVRANSTVEVAKDVYVVKPLYGPPLEVALTIRTSGGRSCWSAAATQES